MIKSLLISAALMGASIGAANASTVVFNDNFESDSEVLNATLNNWTVTNGSVDVIGQASYPWYSSGKQIDMNGSTGMTGRIETSALTLQVGKAYKLSFGYGYNKNSGAYEQMSFGVGSATGVVGPALIGSVAPPTLNTYNFVFKANAASASIFFADDDVSPGDWGGPVLDNVVLAAVPVPAAAPLLLGALGGLAMLRRRRRA